MEIIRMFILIVVLFAAPFLPGMLFGKKSISGTYIAGMLLLWGSFEIVAMAAVIRGWDITKLAERSCYVLLLLGGAGAAVFCIQMVRKKRSGILKEEKNGCLREMVLIVPAFVLAGSSLFFYAPKLESWYLVPETVNTILDTGSLQGYNPLTGQPLGAPKGIGESFLNLPAFYACLAKWFQVDIKVLLFRLMPFWVLFISFLVFYQFAAFLFGKWKKGRILFLWVYALVLLLGDRAYMNESYQMLHYAYEGRAILTGILLPYCFYLFSVAGTGLVKGEEKRRIRVVGSLVWLMEYILVIVSGLFVGGADYGLGLLMAMTVLSCLVGAIGGVIRLSGGKKQRNI